jgi:AcrR family transcriptional regulator
MQRDNQDERFCVIEDAIVDALFLVLKTKDLDKITVTDIIKKAGIVRSTFYNHYENIPALVEAVEDKTIADILALMETFHPKNDHEMCHSYFLTICDYTMNNPFLANLLKSPRGDKFFEKAITMFHSYVVSATERSTASAHSTEEFSYMIACTIGSTIGVLHKWTNEHFKSSKEFIADVLTNMFMSGILPFLS